MNAAIKLLFTTVVFIIIFNSTTFGNTNWKAWDYYCDAIDAKITSTPNYYEKINFINRSIDICYVSSNSNRYNNTNTK